jgi:hypothetical protein
VEWALSLVMVLTLVFSAIDLGRFFLLETSLRNATEILAMEMQQNNWTAQSPNLSLWAQQRASNLAAGQSGGLLNGADLVLTLTPQTIITISGNSLTPVQIKAVHPFISNTPLSFLSNQILDFSPTIEQTVLIPSEAG